MTPTSELLPSAAGGAKANVWTSKAVYAHINKNISSAEYFVGRPGFVNTAIAARDYYRVDTRQVYRLEIFAPYMPENANGSWRCKINIQGDEVPDGLDTIEAGGNDSYQALLLAFKMAKGMMESLNKNYLDSNLRLLEDGNEDLSLG